MKKLFSILLLLLLLIPFTTALAWEPGFQTHDYYVVFDGEGEAAVLAQITLDNYDDNLDTIEFEIPGQDFRIISVVQKYSIEDEGEDYWYYDWDFANIDYEIEELSESILMTLDIPEKDQESIYLYIYYKSESYAEQKGDVFNFNFESIMSESDIHTMSVSIDVVEDLYLQGGSTETDYRSNLAAGTFDVAEEMMYAPYMKNSNFIENTGALDPHESFHVTGKYAESWFAINWWKVILGIFFFGAVLLAAVYGIKTGIKEKKMKRSVLFGSIFGLVLSFFWLVVAYLLTNLHNLVGYMYDDIFALFLVLITILISLLLLAIPPIFIGMKYGFKHGIWCLVSLVITLTLFLIIGAVLMTALFSSEPVFRTAIAEAVAI